MDVLALLTQKPVPEYFQASLTDALWDELQPLLQRHYAAISACPDQPLAPDHPTYDLLARLGRLRIYLARIDARLVGYAAFIVHQHLHYRELRIAEADVLWVDEAYRAGSTVGADLLRVAEQGLAEDGVDLICHRSKRAQPIDHFLARLGYEAQETVFVKRLDATDREV